METPVTKVPYPCVGKPHGACPSLCCYQAADALKSIVDLKLSGHPVDPAIFDFPYKVDDNGKCENVMDDGGCAVYLNRPILCNIERATEAMGLDPMIFMPSNAEQCNAFMDSMLIPKEKQIDVEKYRLELLKEHFEKYPLTPDEAIPPTGEPRDSQHHRSSPECQSLEEKHPPDQAGQ